MNPPLHEIDTRLDGVPDDVRAAREFVRDLLRASGWHGDANAALLVVSELVTNAVVHSRNGFRLHLEIDGTDLLVEVADGGRLFSAHDVPPPWANPEAIGGRGLAIVDAFSTSWGVRGSDGDKCVWARISQGPVPI